MNADLGDRPWRGYAVALAAVSVAFLSTYLTWPLLQPTPWAFFFAAVMASAWRGGLGPSLLATALSAALGNYFFIGPHAAFSRSPAGVIATLVFVSVSLFIGLLASARRRAQELERRQRHWFEGTLSSIGDAVIATDAEGHVTFMNPVAQQLTRWAPSEALRRPLGDVFHVINESTRDRVEDPVSRVLREGTVVGLANHTVLIGRDGTETPIDDSGAPIRDGAGKTLGVVLVFRDVTERKRLEQELRNRLVELAETDRRKDEFLAMLAHELRNPVAAISNAVQLTGFFGDREQSEWSVEVINRQIKHLSRLIDDLLDVSRITRGKIQLRKETVDVAPILKSAAETVRHLLDERKHELTVSVTPGTLWLEADPTRLEQILSNLLSNAAKYTENGGHIRLSADREGEDILIRVRDTGIGISPEKLPQMFELFAQGDRSLARSEGGLGIGLTLARSLTEMHGGSVTAASDGPGKGAEFTIRLPAAERPEARAPRAGTSEPGRAHARVLVVDDNVDSARSLAQLLKLLGHDVQMAHDGTSALEVARSFRAEVVLLDIGLPGLDGYQVARRLRAEDCGRDARIIAITGYGHEEDRRRSREAGFDHHLVKPIDFRSLVTLLAEPTMTSSAGGMMNRP